MDWGDTDSATQTQTHMHTAIECRMNIHTAVEAGTKEDRETATQIDSHAYTVYSEQTCSVMAEYTHAKS